MTAKEYLSQAYRLEQRIEMHQKEIEELKLIATSVSSPGFEERYNSNKNTNSPFEKTVIKAIEMEEKSVNMLNRLLYFKTELIESINSVADKDERLVLYRRYICNETWVQIGEQLGRDERTIRRLHGRACAKFKIPDNPTIID